MFKYLDSQNQQYIFIDYMLEDYIQMLTMSYCDHLIISNSTFSWWSAWLKQKNNHTNNNPIIIRPNIWFNKEGAEADKLDQSDLCPDDWICI